MKNFNCARCVTMLELNVLYEMSALISDHQKLEESAEKSLEILRKTLHLENCVIYTLNEDLLTIFASINFNKQQKFMSEYKLGEGATGLAAESKEPIVIENIHNDMLFLNKSGNRTRQTISYVAVPMMIENEVVGVIAANLTKQTEVDLEETIRILSIASTLYAHAISSHKMVQQEKERLKELKLYYKMEWDAKVHNFGDIIGDSPKMNQVFQVV
ncbi:MAG TPA: GAF domain-containing protein, partial [Campylobacterales bacterium]|nr:GAF domain-containing protein [Campylobacterales bacterium]